MGVQDRHKEEAVSSRLPFSLDLGVLGHQLWNPSPVASLSAGAHGRADGTRNPCSPATPFVNVVRGERVRRGMMEF